MDTPNFWEWILFAGSGALGWWNQTMYTEQRQIARDLSEHKEEVAKDYATKPDLQRIDDKLDRILERLPPKP